jgi:hypothetical protein
MTFNLVEFITRLRSAMGRVRASHILASIATDEYKTHADFPEMTLRIFDVEVENGEDLQFLYKGELFIFDAVKVLPTRLVSVSCRKIDKPLSCLRLNRENTDEQSRTFYEPGELIAAICAENFIVR